MLTFNGEVLDINGQDGYYYDFDIDILDIKEAVEEQLYQEARAMDAEFIKQYGCNYDEDTTDILPF